MVSVIIPVYNEEKIIASTLEKLYHFQEIEIIIVDGGSKDRTLEIIKRSPVVVLTANKKRASQMNKGAKEARGDILLFLHADCYLEENSMEAIKNCIKRGIEGGCFQQKIISSNIIYRFIEFSGNLRAKLFKIFYGDQAIFVKKSIFFSRGGFPEVDLFEDILFSQRLKKTKTTVLPKKVYTSSRRWQKQGIIQTTVINWFLTICFILKIPISSLKYLYQDIR